MVLGLAPALLLHWAVLIAGITTRRFVAGKRCLASAGSLVHPLVLLLAGCLLFPTLPELLGTLGIIP